MGGGGLVARVSGENISSVIVHLLLDLDARLRGRNADWAGKR